MKFEISVISDNNYRLLFDRRRIYLCRVNDVFFGTIHVPIVRGWQYVIVIHKLTWNKQELMLIGPMYIYFMNVRQKEYSRRSPQLYILDSRRITSRIRKTNHTTHVSDDIG